MKKYIGTSRRNGEDVRYLSQHVVVAEQVLGKPLPPRAQVHHVNGNGRDNRAANLVICEDAEYHRLLHLRERALRACGVAHFRVCVICKKYDNPEVMRFKESNRTYVHRACHAAAEALRLGRERRK